MTDANGVVVARERYSAFGERRRGESSTALITDQLYTAQRYNFLSGLYHYSDGTSAGRFYDPLLGRFIKPDSITPGKASQSLNRYAYSFNNPIRYNDPNGQTPWDVVDVIFWGLSMTDFRQDPSFANAAWLLLDTISLAPGLPSTGWIRFPGRAGRVADEIAQFASRHADEALKFVHIAHKPGAYTLLEKFLKATTTSAIKGAKFELEYALLKSQEIVEIGRKLPGGSEIDFVLEGNVFVNVKHYDWGSDYFKLPFALPETIKDFKKQYDIYKKHSDQVKFVFKGSVPDLVRQELEAIGAIVEVIP